MSTTGLALILALAALEAPHNEALERAWQAWNQLDYDRVSDLLDEAAASELSVEDRVRYLELRALVLAIYGDYDAAVDAFGRLLEENPDYAAPDGTAPKIVEALEAARRALQRAESSSPSATEVTPDAPSATATPPGAAVDAPGDSPTPTVSEELPAAKGGRFPAWRIGVEAAGARLLGAPQDDFYEPWGLGGFVRAGATSGLFALELQGGVLRFSERRGDRHGFANLIGAGGSLELSGDSVRLTIDTHAGIARTGQLTRFSFDAGARAIVALRGLGVGPALRYTQIRARQRDARAVGDAHLLSFGIAVALESAP